jgi:hypothetical protein
MPWAPAATTPAERAKIAPITVMSLMMITGGFTAETTREQSKQILSFGGEFYPSV